MIPQPKISVVVPLKNINANIHECVEYLKGQSYRNFDVYIITDGSETFDAGDLDIHFLSSGAVPPNYKRMQAAAQSDAEILALIDDDAYPVAGWLSAAARHFADAHIVGVGGPAVTPREDSASQQVSGAVYASPLVSAGYVYRYSARKQRMVEDYPSCNLLVRREAFLQCVPECLKYWPGEDTKLCLLLTKAGSQIVYDPAVIVYHHRRKLFWGHCRQVWNYAVHRGFFAKRYPETSLRPQYFVPTLFVAANPILLRLLWSSQYRIPVWVGIGFYLGCLAVEAQRARKTYRVNPVMVALGIYITHITYGVGFALGLLRPELEH